MWGIRAGLRAMDLWGISLEPLVLPVILGQFSLALFWGHPFKEVWAQAGAVVGQGAPEEAKKKNFVHYENFRAMLPLWICLNDVVSSLAAVVQMGLRLQRSDPLSNAEVAFLWLAMMMGCLLRFIHQCGSFETIRRDTALMVSVLLSATVLAPSELQRVAGLGRIAAIELVPEPRLGLKMQIASLPIHALVFVLWTPSIFELVLFAVSEVICLASVLLVYINRDSTLSKQVVSTIFAERCAQEATSMADALKRLLSITCDATASISKDLQIGMLSESFLGLLRATRQAIGQPFTDFVSSHDQARFHSMVELAGSSPDSSPITGPLRLADANGVTFKAKVFLVKLAEAGHFVGLTRDEHEEHLSEHGLDGGASDMRFLVGRQSRIFSEENPTETVPSQCIQELKELEKITLLVDALSEEEGFILRSVTFDFSEPSEQVKVQQLPNLLEWLEHRCRSSVRDWVQAEVQPRAKPRKTQGVDFRRGGRILFLKPAQNVEGGALIAHLQQQEQDMPCLDLFLMPCSTKEKNLKLADCIS
ncbi:unnamed protein product [Durusdinium trenchii]|uniref:Uncharacterized protein n=1 Tax=Durusdinium trenchii TaxID=1381693 RepID=A0ABP0Q9C6_9DINO